MKLRNNSQPTESVWSSKIIVQLLISVFLFGTIALGIRYYFTSVQTPSYIGFYKGMPIAGFQITKDDIHSILIEETNTDFKKMAVQSAFSRYQMDNSAGGIFYQYLTKYQTGIWQIPETPVWVDAFKKFIDEWQKKRNVYIASGKKIISPQVNRGKKQEIIINFPAGARSWKLGKVMRIFVTIPRASVMDTPAKIIWPWYDPAGNRHFKDFEAQWDLKSTKSGTSLVGSITLDLFYDIEWMRTDTRVVTFVINGPEVAKWNLVAIKFD